MEIYEEERKKMSQTVVLDMFKKTLPLRRFTVSEYHRMGEAGILSEDDRVELMDGVIIQQMPQKSKHSAVIRKLSAPFYPLVLEGKALLSVQLPLILTDDTEPEPDLLVVKPREDAYGEAHPASEDVLLLIEVSDTTLEYDTDVKLPRYAASGIPDVWIVNLVDNHIEVIVTPSHFPMEHRFTESERTL